MKSFQDNLRELMNERNFTQKSLAERSGVPSSSIASWLGKQASLPNIEAAAKIASALGCSVDYLLDRETDDASVVRFAPRGASELKRRASTGLSLPPPVRPPRGE